jgi:fructokinase
MFWGIDLGGTKIEGIVLKEADANAVIARYRIDTQGEGGYQHVLNRIDTVIDELERLSGAKLTHLGIGTPGTVDSANGFLKNSNTLCLNGKPIDKDLEVQLGVPVRIANDANCFALAEFQLGAVQDFPNAKNMFGVIMGTGVGGGIIIDGRIINGLHGMGGEWGHMFLDISGGPCYCGRSGCVETIISGTALQQYYFSKTGNKKLLKDIFSDLHDPVSQEVKQRLIHFFGRALGQIITFLDPHVVVLGGGLSNLDFLYTDGRDEVAKNIFNSILNTPIVRPRLGDSAGVFGAALLK